MLSNPIRIDPIRSNFGSDRIDPFFLGRSDPNSILDRSKFLTLNINLIFRPKIVNLIYHIKYLKYLSLLQVKNNH